jgi:hypothetical protein
MMPSGGEEHMFVLIAEANAGKPDHSFLLVNFSSVKPDCYVDPACVVEGGKKHHEFLRKESFVAYSFATVEKATELTRMVDRGIFKPLTPVSDDLRLRIGKGVRRSERIAPKHRGYFVAYTDG